MNGTGWYWMGVPIWTWEMGLSRDNQVSACRYGRIFNESYWNCWFGKLVKVKTADNNVRARSWREENGRNWICFRLNDKSIAPPLAAAIVINKACGIQGNLINNLIRLLIAQIREASIASSNTFSISLKHLLLYWIYVVLFALRLSSVRALFDFACLSASVQFSPFQLCLSLRFAFGSRISRQPVRPHFTPS